MQFHSPHDIADLNGESFGPFGMPYLALKLADWPEDDAVRAVLRGLPCPVLGVGGGALASACDVVVDSEDALAGILGNIAAAPMAAMTLVQVLRATEHLPPAQGLVLESLAYGTLQSGVEFRNWLATRKTPPAPPVENGPPLLVAREGGDLRLTLNRPGNRNAISIEMRDALAEAFDLAATDPSIESVVVDGAGACFSVGGDLSEFGSAPDSATAHAVRSVRLPAARLLPVAGRTQMQLHGAVIGSGLEVAAFAGRVTAKDDTFFQLPELKFGLIPGAGGCVSVPRRIGRQRAGYMALSARRIPARMALDWGLIDEIVS